MIEWVILYFSIGVLWGFYACSQQMKYFGINRLLPAIVLVNILLFPICMCYATTFKKRMGIKVKPFDNLGGK